ncbi:hypothetical protein BDW59DRAFT_145632 [Aspergillus cavernicola]|uniref:Uncharacterized protein n=1 Tax=Aspergillus cavernicola TaxID=176166 RepID=A0ABR4IDV7_9EURO
MRKLMLMFTAAWNVGWIQGQLRQRRQDQVNQGWERKRDEWKEEKKRIHHLALRGETRISERGKEREAKRRDQRQTEGWSMPRKRVIHHNSREQQTQAKERREFPRTAPRRPAQRDKNSNYTGRTIL